MKHSRLEIIIFCMWSFNLNFALSVGQIRQLRYKISVFGTGFR